ncbi:MAG TPA: helix-turn-helix domain-containing protein, partial [Actinomycetes bacterium]|nr:helix-turn-helix domain-containing protein [Actinomycetes bacterium]
PGVGRVVSVLDFLAEHPEEAFNLSELCRRLDLNKATAHALLSSLTEKAWLLRHPLDKTFTLGPGLVAVAGAAAARQLELVDYARGEMRRLADELDVQCVASAVRGDEIVLLAVAGVARPLGVNVHAGQRVPLTPPIGTVFLAWSSPAEIDRWLRRLGSDAGEADLDGYRRALAAVRRRGYAVSLEADARVLLERALTEGGDRPLGDVLTELGRQDYLLLELEPAHSYRLSMIAAPVFGPEGGVELALSLFDLPGQMAADQVPALAQRLVDAAATVTKAIGGRPPDPEA